LIFLCNLHQFASSLFPVQWFFWGGAGWLEALHCIQLRLWVLHNVGHLLKQDAVFPLDFSVALCSKNDKVSVIKGIFRIWIWERLYEREFAKQIEKALTYIPSEPLSCHFSGHLYWVPCQRAVTGTALWLSTSRTSVSSCEYLFPVVSISCRGIWMGTVRAQDLSLISICNINNNW